MNESFEQSDFYNTNFRFLNKFFNTGDIYLKSKCNNLENLLRQSYNGTELFDEIFAFKNILGLHNQHTIEILNI